MLNRITTSLDTVYPKISIYLSTQEAARGKAPPMTKEPKKEEDSVQKRRNLI